MSDARYIPVNKQFMDVADFNRRILEIKPRSLSMQPEDEMRLSLHQMREELSEIEEAYKNGDFIGVLDGLIDLEYFLLGVFYKNGIDEDMHRDLFDAVHSANMLKKMGVKAGREGYGAADAVKPDSWVDPEIKFARILEQGKKF